MKPALVRIGNGTRTGEYHTVVVGTDGSETSFQADDAAAQIALEMSRPPRRMSGCPICAPGWHSGRS